MKVLVTGGLGFIGSHTTVSLIEQGYEVVIIDNLSNSHLGVLDVLNKITQKKIPFYKIDATDEKKLKQVFEIESFDAVIHFAGFKAVGESVQIPLKYYFNNLMSTISVANLCKQYGVQKFVFSSSSTVYGENNTSVYETMSLFPTTNPYGETKAMCERILRDLCKSDDTFEIAILRYFNPIGAHSTGLIGELPNGIPNNLMPYITQVAKGKRPYLEVFGNDYPTIDGTGVRDYIHVMDLAEGHVAALKKLNRGAHVYNLGTGSGTSVLQLITAFEKVNDIRVPYKIVGRRLGDIAYSVANVDKAKNELGWSAKRTIEVMCEDSWRFERMLKIK